tara:strand:- start:627 stop:1196 length:570 start_codon:yes stop_codon:yes gene_type:complete
MSTLQVNKITPSTGTDITLGDSGDTFTIPSGVTLTNNGTVTGIGGTNTPAFEAKLSLVQSIPDNTGTIVQFDTEEFDTDSAYNTSTYQFTPQTAGKYYVYLSIACNAGADFELADNYAMIVKNGTNIKISHFNYAGYRIRFSTAVVSAVVDLNGSTDYISARVQGADSSGNLSLGRNEYSTFGAYRIIE